MTIGAGISESKESGAKYRGLLEAAPDAMVVVNQSGEIVLLNVQAEKQFGYSRDELIGQKVKNIIPEGFAERLIADGTRSAAEALAQQIGTGIELSGRRKNGSEFPIEIMLSPLESAEGILITAAIRNISVRKDAEKHLALMEGGRRLAEGELRESEERYRLLLDGIQDSALFMMDLTGRVVSWNAGAQRIKGYTADEIIGRNFSCFFPPEDIEQGKPQQVLCITAASGRHEEQGMRVRKDGSQFLASLTFTALRDAAGNLRGFSEFSHDLSARKASEARYRGLLEAAPDAMVVVNQGGEIVLLNAQAEKQFGYRRDELLGQKVTNIIPKGFAERLIADGTRSAAEALAQQIGTGIELSGRRKDGSEFPIEIMLSPLESAEGILVTAAVRDISARKTSEARYRGLLEAAPDAMVVVNQGGEIVLLNAQAETQFGYRRDELLGQKVTNIIPKGFAERLIADGTRSAAEALAQQIGTGIELSGRRRDGSEFPIEIMLSPLESAEGILVTAAVRDISARKRAEEALRRSEESYRLIVSNVKDYAMLMLDTTGVVVSWNDGAEKIKGYKADEIIGRNFSCFYTAQGLKGGKPAFGLEQATKHERFEDEGWRVRKDGSLYFADVVITALRDETGRLRGFGKIIRDITERKKAEKRLVTMVAELKRSNDELQQFAYVASHDLQEPLRMVASFTQLLASRYKGQLDSDADEFIAFAVDGCNRMRGLIQDLLAYSRAGTSGKTLRETSAEDALQAALANLRTAIGESGAVVTHDPLPAITTDGTQLTQVFQNLVGNAIKYRSLEIPQVHVSATKSDGREWIFSVRDNGLGIDPQYFDRIFVLFQRLHPQNEFEGTGIGLAVSKKIVERLGGRIWVESESGKGSTFHFSLPERDEK
jgi:PAS domain S-box-containing protein